MKTRVSLNLHPPVYLLKDIITEKKSYALIKNGVDHTNAKILVDAGCNILVAGIYLMQRIKWRQFAD